LLAQLMGAVHAQPHVVDFGLPLVNGELHLQTRPARLVSVGVPVSGKQGEAGLGTTSSMLYGPVIGLVVSLSVPLNSHSERSDNSDRAVPERPMLSIGF
jgi:hypothetical protein